MDPRLDPILHRAPEWLDADGPEDDVVVSSRVRLARNVSDRPFPRLLDGPRAQQLCDELEAQLEPIFENGLCLDPAGLDAPEAEFLIERSLATRDLFEASIPARILFLGDGSCGLMVNEEDHFRAQGFAAGLDLESARRLCTQVTDRLAERFRLARHDRYGFLTTCPTNAGSGMRASLMMHLPGLARARHPLQQVLQTAERASLAVRGVHGEGSRALGNLYQISNQITLGVPAKQQISAVQRFGLQAAQFERSTRASFATDEGKRTALVSDAQAAWQTLSNADRLSTAQALQSLSLVRLAILVGLGAEICGEAQPSHSALLTLCFQLQPGHLQARFGQALDPERRDVSRALMVRQGLGLSSPS